MTDNELTDDEAAIARVAYSVGHRAALRYMADCRMCSHFVGLGSPCLSTLQCVEASQFNRVQPVQQWERKNG